MAMTLLIVEDHEGFRSSARAALSEDGFDVSGDVPDGESALAAVAELHPDIVLLDVQLAGSDGFEVARRLASRSAARRPARTGSTSGCSTPPAATGRSTPKLTLQ
jgi:DNA-binding NarL/FixJ family response regulator